MRVYIESTIPSYVVARPARDLRQAARQLIAKDWWDRKRGEHELFTSQFVLDEIAAGEPEMARHRLELMDGITLLEPLPTAESLTLHILQLGILLPSADGDAAHIALATVHQMEVILSLNLRHIANAVIESRLRKLVEKSGYVLPLLCTPDVLIGESTGEIDE